MPGRALIVEDEHELAELFAEILRLRGLESHVLHLGAPAPQWVRENQPDLVLLDLMLPDRDGYSVCEELKLDRQTNLTPIVMVTARAGHQDMVKGLAVGANEYVTKPFTVDHLNDAIDRAIAWRQELCNCGAQGEIHFELRSDARVLEELNHMLASLFLYTGLPESSVRQLTTAIREMGMNAIEWGHRKQIDRLVNVTYRIEADRVVIKIKDTGPGFDPKHLPHAADPEDPAKHMEVRDSLGLRAGGFGILMTKGLVDELKYNETGNEVRIVKYFQPKPQ
jgi:CheY-like chemotaxis protein/anti-sigma regulatory factor (Ser/Thr protein kinase)